MKIAGMFRQQGKKIRILCAGDWNTPYGRSVAQTIDTEDLKAYIQLLGICKDVPALMERADVFVLPSRYEGMPLVLLEAQAAGLHCIVADTCSHEADFGLGTVHWMEPDADVITWAEEIEKAAALGKTDKEAVCRAAEVKGFCTEQFALQVLGLYERYVC